jgi:NADH:ubiquinone oxidoreductase subunit K
MVGAEALQSVLTQIGLMHYLTLGATLFVLGLMGVMTSRNLIRVLMCVELMLNAVNINFVAFNHFVHPAFLAGQVFSIFILTVSAAEAAVGLALVMALYRAKSSVDIDAYQGLQG